MLTRTLLFLALWVITLPSIWAEDSAEKYICRRKDGDVKFDGRLNDPVWKNKLIAKSFFKSKILGLAKYQTEVYCMWDDEYLYIAAHMTDDDIVANLSNRDDPLYDEDAFEFFIRPDSNSNFIYEFEFSPRAVIWDGLNRRTPENGSGYKGVTTRSWNAVGLKCAADVQGTLNNFTDKDKGWSVEIKIPLRAFVTLSTLPKKGDTWPLVFARCESSIYLDQVEWSASIPLDKYGEWEHYTEWRSMVFE